MADRNPQALPALALLLLAVVIISALATCVYLTLLGITGPVIFFVALIGGAATMAMQRIAIRRGFEE